MKVSIIITNYNYEKYLGRCIRSCISQSLSKKDFEIIVVDDNSTDSSLKKLDEFKNNIKIISNKKNIGVAKSVNKAVKIAKGDYFVRIDADDYISSYLIAFLYNGFLIFPEKFGIACDYYHVTNEGRHINKIESEDKPIACGILYNKKKFISYGMYNPKFKHREEEELRLRLGKKYDLHYLNLPLYRYRMHQTNKTKSKNYLINFRKKIEKITTIKNKKEIIDSKLLNRVVAIIPARGNSKRLKNKNIYKIAGKPMIGWPITEVKKSSLINELYVSSESKKILNVSKKYGAKVIERPPKLSKDNVYKLDVIKHAIKLIEKKNKKKVTLILSVQANSPEIKMKDIEDAIKKLIRDNLQEVISVDKNFNCNAAIRVMTREALFQTSLSTNHGFIKLNIKDIHFEKDIKEIKKL
jgi:glycosyltransferase involved in cell wall biosynthesis